MSPSDRSAPGVRITSLTDERAASGAPLNLDGRVLGFSYEDSALKADQASLQLDNFDLSLFDRPELAGGAVLEGQRREPVVVGGLVHQGQLLLPGVQLQGLLGLEQPHLRGLVRLHGEGEVGALGHHPLPAQEGHVVLAGGVEHEGAGEIAALHGEWNPRAVDDQHRLVDVAIGVGLDRDFGAGGPGDVARGAAHGAWLEAGVGRVAVAQLEVAGDGLAARDGAHLGRDIRLM